MEPNHERIMIPCMVDCWYGEASLLSQSAEVGRSERTWPKDAQYRAQYHAYILISNIWKIC